MAEFQIVPLNDTHDRTAFRCGVPSLDDFIQRFANQHARKQLSRTYIVARPNETRVLGYYTIAIDSIPFEDLPPELSKKLPRYKVPAILLGRLAVDSSVRGQGLGGNLLYDAFRKVQLIESLAGGYLLHVHAVDATAASFYLRYQFQPLGGQPHHLVLPVRTIQQLLSLADPPSSGTQSVDTP